MTPFEIGTEITRALGLSLDHHIVSVDIHLDASSWPTAHVVMELHSDNAGRLIAALRKFRLLEVSRQDVALNGVNDLDSLVNRAREESAES